MKKQSEPERWELKDQRNNSMKKNINENWFSPTTHPVNLKNPTNPTFR